MAIKTSKWDSADFLTDEESIGAYLEAAFEDGEPHVITHALGAVARARGMTEVARNAGVTRETLYKALSDKGDPRLSTFMGVIKALGFTLSPRPN